MTGCEGWWEPRRLAGRRTTTRQASTHPRKVFARARERTHIHTRVVEDADGARAGGWMEGMGDERKEGVSQC